MSALGPKETWALALHMSALGGQSGHAVLHRICRLVTQSGHPWPLSAQSAADEEARSFCGYMTASRAMYATKGRCRTALLLRSRRPSAIPTGALAIDP